MLGGLYGDLPQAKGADAAEPGAQKPSASAAKPGGWATGASQRLQPPPSLRRPVAAMTPPSVANALSVLRAAKAQSAASSSGRPAAAAARPCVALSGKRWVRAANYCSAQPMATEEANTLQGSANSNSLALQFVNEYFPSRPNDYEEYRREKQRKEQQKQMEEEREFRQREREREERERELQRQGAGNYPPPPPMVGGGGGGNAYPPPPPMHNNNEFAPPAAYQTAPEPEAPKMSAAQRMMAKMGWKDGQGLGANNQGIATPLMAKKTDTRSAVITNAPEMQLLPGAAPKPKPSGLSALSGTPTRILLLRNMVGPGEVDDDLEEEVAEETAKYGEVVRVMIFEVTDPNYPVQEAVRIFVEFTRPENATKGVIDLDGRFFGGRVVHACFFDEEKFARCELAPSPDEPRI